MNLLTSRRLSLLMVSVIIQFYATPASAGSTSSPAEIFRYDQWDSTTLAWTWEIIEGIASVYFNNQQRVIQNYVDFDTSATSGRVLSLFSRFTDEASNLRNFSVQNKVQAIDSRKELTFRYGEIEWIAKISPSNNVFNIFRIGQWSWDASPSLNVNDAENLDGSSVQLVLQAGENPTSVRADVFFPQKPSLNSSSPDSSQNSASDWITLPCELCSKDLSKAFYSYRLRWTSTELVWYINNTEIYRLKNTHKIPQKELSVVLYVATGENFTSKDEGELLVQSVIIKQNQTDRVKVEDTGFTNVFTEDFSAIQLDPTLWRTEDGATVGDVNALYVPEDIQVKDGFLQFMSEQVGNDSFEGTYYTLGRVEATEKLSLLYGEVEWMMRAHSIPGIRNVLSLGDKEHTQDKDGERCCISSINFAYLHNGQVKIESELFRIGEDKESGGAEADFGDRKSYNFYNAFLKSNTTTDFHQYRILWTKDYLVLHIDDVEVQRLTNLTAIPDKPMYISMWSELLNQPQWQTRINHRMISMEVEYVVIRRAPPEPVKLTEKSDLSDAKGLTASAPQCLFLTNIKTSILLALIVLKM